ncbi:MAG: hypothetical protein WD768_01615 [Phycisphaeraceae bacterium]
MKQDLVDIFEAETLMEAKLLTDRLTEAGIESFIDNTDSPLDGLSAAGQMKIVRVLPKDQDKAEAIAQAFLSEKMGDADFGDLGEDDDE